MQPDDYYKSLGLKCGIEIHRQLDTGKLFCGCSSKMQNEPRGEIRRRLRAVAGELGELDPAALHEAMRGKEFVYKIYPEESCLVELDEEPPHEPDKVALEISLVVSTMLNARIPDEIHFMRKTVVDGSNTGGFQRTAIVGMDGSLNVSFGKIGITNISLEEESAQILGKENDKTIFGLNRLGIPLVEIGTSPDIKTPAQAREVAEKIGAMLRSTGRVKRGIGTIRQDINVSVSDGERVEIKGVQELNMLSEIVASEAERQKSLVELKKEIKRKNLKMPELNIFDATNILSSASSKILSGKKSYGIVLPGFSGIFKVQLNTHRRIGREIADYTRANAGVAGIIHTDEDLSKYGAEKEFSALRTFVSAKDSDMLVIVASDEKTAKEALKAVYGRVWFLSIGVPKETRRALPDGDSEYMRPLPGAARMYPETDVLPVSVTKEMIFGAKKKIPEPPEKKMARFIKLGLNRELAGQILDSDFLPLFEESLSFRIPAKDIANVFLNVIADLKARENIDASNLSSEKFMGIFALLEKGKIGKDAVSLILAKLAKSPEKSVESAVKELGISRMSEDEARKIIRKIIFEEKNKNVGYLTGKCIAALKGRIDNRVVAKIVGEEAAKTV